MQFKTFLYFISAAIISTAFLHGNTLAAVVVYDNATSLRTTIKLKAVTKGLLFPEGGKLIEFYINEEHIGTALSGGDGYAFLEYTPQSSGIKHIKVKKGVEEDEGTLLVTKKDDRVLLIEIENTLLVSNLQDLFQPVKDSKDVLQKLSKNFKIIYLTTVMGTKSSRKWLKEHDFPLSAVLKWTGGDLTDDLRKRKITLHAIIGSENILQNSQGIKNRFCFEETEGAVTVKDWNELSERLNKSWK